MGAKASKYEGTNWEASDGGMTSADQTFTKTEPTKEMTTLTCVPTNQMNPIGVRFDMKVVAGSPSSGDNSSEDDSKQQLYEVKKVETFKHAFEIIDSHSNEQVVMCSGTGGFERMTIYTSTPNWEGQVPDPNGMNLYRRALVSIDTGYYQMSVQFFRAPTEQEAMMEWNLAGVVDPAPHLIVDTVKWQGAPANQTYLPSNPSQLVGWWKWSKPIAIPFIKDKIELQVAKDTDLVMHVALVAIARAARAAAFKGNSDAMQDH